ncbi:MAG TPA: hypothetical protein ENH82_19600 [bacterium]|nr:hypothetical protein [bacterium]
MKKISFNKATGVGRRMPAAVITTKDGRKIYVDKFGKEIKNHGYDLDNDPRGFKTTGRGKSNVKVII